jgi:hypothetical protein
MNEIQFFGLQGPTWRMFSLRAQQIQDTLLRIGQWRKTPMNLSLYSKAGESHAAKSAQHHFSRGAVGNEFARKAAQYYIDALATAFPLRVITKPLDFVNSVSELLGTKLERHQRRFVSLREKHSEQLKII